MVKIYLDGMLTHWSGYGPEGSAEKYAISILRLYEGDFCAAAAELEDRANVAKLEQEDPLDPFAGLDRRDAEAAAAARKWLLDNLGGITVEWIYEVVDVEALAAELTRLMDSKEVKWDIVKPMIDNLYRGYCDEHYRTYSRRTAQELAASGYGVSVWEISLTKEDLRDVLKSCEVPEDVAKWVRQVANEAVRQRFVQEMENHEEEE